LGSGRWSRANEMVIPLKALTPPLKSHLEGQGMRLNPRDINCKFNGFHFHPSRLAQKLPGVSILSAKYLKQIVIYIVSESQRREN